MKQLLIIAHCGVNRVILLATLMTLLTALVCVPKLGATEEDEEPDWDSFFETDPDDGNATATFCSDPKEESPTSSGSKSPAPPPCVGSPASCPNNSAGLATWTVSEPTVNLWIKDTPLFYKPSRGPQVKLNLLYKYRQGADGKIDSTTPAIFGFGQQWSSRWRVYMRPIPTEPTNYIVFLGDGSGLKFTLNGIEFKSRGRLVQDGITNVIQTYDGTTLRFGFITNVSGSIHHFLTEKADIHGNTLRFQYLCTNGAVRLQSVVDVDNLSTTFDYASFGIYSNLVTRVVGPHGLTNHLHYDSLGRLTNIVDAIGLSSRIDYSGNAASSLITPYGTNRFSYFQKSNEMVATFVEEHGVRRHLFAYINSVDSSILNADYSSLIPNTTNAYYSIPHTLDYTNANKRNSFHWGPRQFEVLSDTVRTNLINGNFAWTDLTSGDYLNARMKHWLRPPTGDIAGHAISFRKEVSPNGVISGQITWFDYNGKGGGADRQGACIVPTLNAIKLANGDANFSYAQLNTIGNPLLTAATYSGAGNTCQLRTNLYEYGSNAIDLTRHVQVIGAAHRQVSSNVFNASHNVVTNFNALNEAASFIFNSKQQLIFSSTPGGLNVTNMYESTGTWSNFLSKRIALNIQETNSMTYSNGYIATYTDPMGLTKSIVRDALGRRRAIVYPDGTARGWAYTNLNLAHVTNRLGSVKSYTYNRFRQRTMRTDVRSTNMWNYCSCGAVESTVDGLGGTVEFLYDQAGRRCAVLYPGGVAITNHHDVNGRITNVIDSAGNSVTNYYNNQGLIYQVQTSYGYLRRASYDIEDHACHSVDANAITNMYCYDDLGRIICATNGLGAIDTYSYSPLGIIAQTNRMMNWVGYQYDVAGRKIAETNANGGVTQFKYDAASNLTNLIDPKGNNTWWKYDQYGRMIEKTDASGQVIFAYAYDAESRLTNRWTSAKGNTRYSYDSSGNLTNIDYPSSADISFSYDANNRLTQMIDAVGTTTYTYNQHGDLLSEDGPWADDTVSYSYTSNRLRSQLTLLQPNAAAWVQSYAYDRASRLTNIISPAGIFTYTYDPVNTMLVRKLTLPNGSYITNVFDSIGRMTSTTLKNSGHGILNLHSYLYDDADRRTRQTRTDGDYVEYGYDNIGQVASAVGYEPGGTSNRWHERFFYSYDKAGNLSNRVQNVQTNVFSVDILNQLTVVVRTNASATVVGSTTSSASNVTVTANGGAATAAIRFVDATFALTNVTLANGTNTFIAVAGDNLGRWDTNSSIAYLPTAVSLLYDGNGNLRTNGIRIFEYDDENQLTRIAEPGAWKSEFVYDGKLKLRISRDYMWHNSSWLQTNEVRRVYDRMLVVQERDQFNVPKINYTRGKDLGGGIEGAGGIGGLLALNVGNDNLASICYFHSDGNGNVTCLTDTKQTVVGRYLYDPFGNTLSVAGAQAVLNKYRFSSKELHGPSGAIYYRYRWYLTELQRWANSDPIQEAGGINIHQFVSNDPIDLFDSYGLATNDPSQPPCCGPKALAACQSAYKACMAKALKKYNDRIIQIRNDYVRRRTEAQSVHDTAEAGIRGIQRASYTLCEQIADYAARLECYIVADEIADIALDGIGATLSLALRASRLWVTGQVVLARGTLGLERSDCASTASKTCSNWVKP